MKNEDKKNEGLIQYVEAEEQNELIVDRDIIVLANPEIANLPPWVIGLVVAGGLAAALSTAAGLLLVISTSISHDLLKNYLKPEISEKGELWAARIAIAVAVVAAGIAGLNPPGFVAQVVALAFGLAASSFFPAIILGIFDKRMNREGAISGMIVGIVFTAFYIIYFKPQLGGIGSSENYWFGLTVRARVIVYAKDRVDKNELSTYEDLINPKWRNKILVRSSTNAYNQALLSSIVLGVGGSSNTCLLYTSPSPRDATLSRMPSWA